MGSLSGAIGVITLLLLFQWKWGIETAHGQSSTDAHGRSKVPAFYIFGDSTADSGNNNKMYTIARANFPPYGRDFDTRHATGRFSNGKMTSDFITEFLRVPTVPSYLSPEAGLYLYQGANFASAGAGLLNNTGNILGAKISQWEQIELFLEKRNHLIELLGKDGADYHLKNALYYIATGGNDYIHNWITNDTDAALLPHDEFNSLLLTTFESQLKTLYNAGARKVIVLGIGPVGCAPHFLWASNTTTGQCLTKVNKYVSEYNDGLRQLLTRLNRQNHGAKFVYRDIWNIVYRLSHFPLDYGFLVGNTACCGLGAYGGGERCLSPIMVCPNPPDFVWWDEFHPSHRANFIIATQIWSGLDPSTTTDIALRELTGGSANSSSISPDIADIIANTSMPNVTYNFPTVQQLANIDLDDSST